MFWIFLCNGALPVQPAENFVTNAALIQVKNGYLLFGGFNAGYFNARLFLFR
jgi:hypothetical protein